MITNNDDQSGFFIRCLSVSCIWKIVLAWLPVDELTSLLVHALHFAASSTHPFAFAASRKVYALYKHLDRLLWYRRFEDNPPNRGQKGKAPNQCRAQIRGVHSMKPDLLEQFTLRISALLNKWAIVCQRLPDLLLRLLFYS